MLLGAGEITCAMATDYDLPGEDVGRVGCEVVPQPSVLARRGDDEADERVEGHDCGCDRALPSFQWTRPAHSRIKHASSSARPPSPPPAPRPLTAQRQASMSLEASGKSAPALQRQPSTTSPIQSVIHSPLTSSLPRSPQTPPASPSRTPTPRQPPPQPPTASAYHPRRQYPNHPQIPPHPVRVVQIPSTAQPPATPPLVRH